MPSSHLTGKIAVITGGATGIGLAIAQRFVAEGAFVFISGRRQKELDAAVQTLGKNAIGVQGDVSKLADLERLFSVVKEKKGRVDVLVANAAVAETGHIETLTEEHYDKVFDINVKGVVFTVQKALPLIPDGGSIILVGSVASQKANQAFSIYSATKAAVRSLGRSFAVDLKPRKIRVNVLSPGPIATPMLDAAVSQSEALAALIKTSTVLNRIGEPKEIASAAYFLASDESSYVTGADLQVDGGMAQI